MITWSSVRAFLAERYDVARRSRNETLLLCRVPAADGDDTQHVQVLPVVREERLRLLLRADICPAETRALAALEVQFGKVVADAGHLFVEDEVDPAWTNEATIADRVGRLAAEAVRLRGQARRETAALAADNYSD